MELDMSKIGVFATSNTYSSPCLQQDSMEPPSFDSFMDDFFLPLILPEDEQLEEPIVVNFEQIYMQINVYIKSILNKINTPVVLMPDGYYELVSDMRNSIKNITGFITEEIPDFKEREKDIEVAIECWLLNVYT